MSAPAGHPHPPDPGNGEAPPREWQGLGSKSFGDGLQANRTSAERAIATITARLDGHEPMPSMEDCARELENLTGPIDEAVRRQHFAGLRRHATRPDIGVRIATALERIAAALELCAAEGKGVFTPDPTRHHFSSNAEDRPDLDTPLTSRPQ